MKTRKILFWLSVTIIYTVNAQNTPIADSSYSSIFVDDFYHGLNSAKGLILSPFGFNKNDWEKTLYTLGATTLLFYSDAHVKQFSQENKTGSYTSLFKIDRYFNGPHTAYASISLYLTGLFSKHETIRTMGLHSFEAHFFAQSLTGILKYTFGRRRPWAGDNHMNFKIFRGSKQKFRSFPSGHTTSAFTFASVMAMSIDNIYWDVFWYGNATLVAAARIYNNNHWLSDTFLAAILSYSIAHYVVHFDNQSKEQKIAFGLAANYPGIELKWFF